MDNTTPKFSWDLVLTAPREYPVEITEDNYLATDTSFITGMTNIGGMIHDGWLSGMVGETMGGGGQLPTKISLTWVSYAEKKFWKLEDSTTLLKARDRMQALIDTGYIYKDYIDSVLKRTTYKRIAIGMAPSGMVVVWLVGKERCTQVATMQAKPTKVDYRRLLPVAGTFNDEQDFLDWNYKNEVPDTIQAYIAAYGLPYNLWKNYAQRYNWRFRVQFYREGDTETRFRHAFYWNGEEDKLIGEDLNKYFDKGLPKRVDFYFKEHWVEAKFDYDELSAAFKELSKSDPNEPIEIILKLGFEFYGQTFRIRNSKHEIQLKKVKDDVYGYKRPNH